MNDYDGVILDFETDQTELWEGQKTKTKSACWKAKIGGGGIVLHGCHAHFFYGYHGILSHRKM